MAGSKRKCFVLGALAALFAMKNENHSIFSLCEKVWCAFLSHADK